MNNTIWLRLGISLSGTERDISAVINGDAYTLKRMIENRQFYADGGSYIPAESISDYNEAHGTNFDEYEMSLDVGTTEYNVKAPKSLYCSMVLRLMDTEEYSNNYCGALRLVSMIFPEVNVEHLEKELNRYI